MRRYLDWSIVLMILLVFTTISQAGTYTSDFHQYVDYHESDDVIGVVITMTERVDLEALKSELLSRHANRQEWHETVIRRLQENATITQSSILARLDDLQSQGLVDNYQGMWLGNLILVTGKPSAFDDLVQREDVLEISPNYSLVDEEPNTNDTPTLSSSGVESALEIIHADEVWAMGITGYGRLVSHLDSGVDGNHPAFKNRWRGLDSRYSDHPEWAWFDPVTNTGFPRDFGMHGTFTMGTICGLGEEFGDTVGVAFGAEWISAGIIDRVSPERTIQNSLLALQWLADPDGDPVTVWDVPDVCSNSWGLNENHGVAPCDQAFWGVIDDLEAAGTVVIFGAGNDGPSPNTIRRPGDRATTELSTFAVGAVDGNNPALTIAEFSSRGPSYCTRDGSPAIKPEISAPGVMVRSCLPGGVYGEMSGTSMATPYVAGVIALMREANPDLSSDQVKQILLDTARDLGVPGDDNSYGMGIVDAYDAVTAALIIRGGWGILAGTVTEQNNNIPISGTVVRVENRPWRTITATDGTYSLNIPADTTFNIIVEKQPNYWSTMGRHSVMENETSTADFTLERKISVTLKTSFANPEDITYRTFYVKGSWDNDGHYDANWSGDYIAVKDDGVWPDAVAGDGIVTGSIYLAVNGEMPYSWAIFTENYGSTEISKLDNGADFVINNFTSPDVPVLAVNPTGRDGNFGFSVVCDNGLAMDLTPGVDNREWIWGASADLTGGTSYTFNFHVMHADLPVYGSGGLGGADIEFTPEFSGSYTFIFNDRDDSYLVKDPDTDGPPSNLTVLGGNDAHIPVMWQTPGADLQELGYDDGVVIEGIYAYSKTTLMATMFVPESYPLVLDSVLIRVLAEGDTGWPWPDIHHDPLGISVFLDRGMGIPRDEPVFYTEAVSGLDGWLRIGTNNIVLTSGNFWVAVNNLSDDGPYDAMAVDDVTDFPANRWCRVNDVWGLENTFPGDFMIHALVFGADGSSILGYDNTLPAGELAPGVQYHGYDDTFVGLHNTSIKPLRASQNQAFPSRKVYHPQLLSNRSMLLDIQELTGFNLYRDTSPAPYDRGMKVNRRELTDNFFDDYGTDASGPIVNGVTYYYQASAIYDINGSLVEVGPSNQVIGIAENQPPETPANLIGEVDGNTVTLSWNPNTDYDIASYNVYRRDHNQFAYTLIGNISHPNIDYSEELAVDGHYRYKIKAVDSGGLESVSYSNYFDAVVGIIPPGILTASDSLENQVMLSWGKPGGLTLDGGSINLGMVISDSVNSEYYIAKHLIESGEVNSIEVIDARFNTPTLEDLERFDVLLIWPNFTFQDPTALGDVIADYIDSGRGVIVLGFAFYDYNQIAGRFQNEYCPLESGTIGFREVYLGEHIADHPLMMGVDDIATFFAINATSRDNANTIAYWNNGWPAVATNRDLHNLVCINAYCGYYNNGHYEDNGMMKLIVNAVKYVTYGQGVISDTYVVYKSDSENGVYDVLTELPGDYNSFTDGGLRNNVPYYYRVTSFWGRDESQPSNTAIGQGYNYPPEAPTGLTTTVDFHDVNLNWEFTNTMSDLSHFLIYRKQSGDESWEQIAETSTIGYTDRISGSADGVFQYTVTAVDNGRPALESEHSNVANAAIGNMPPNYLIAKNKQDGVVPLSWSEPGAKSIVTLAYDDGEAYRPFNVSANSNENIVACQFNATAPVEICSLWVRVLTEGDSEWPRLDSEHNPVRITIWEDNGHFVPGDMIYEQITTAETGEGIAIGFDTPLICETNNFWVGFNNLHYYEQLDYVMYDDSLEHEENIWLRYRGNWNRENPYIYGDLMIRAGVLADNQVELASRGGSGKSPSELPVSTNMQLKQSSAYESVIASILDSEQLLGYYIYRGESPEVPIDDEHRLTSDYVIETNYEDREVENGTTYYYKAVAVYDNSRIIEYSEPTDEVSATPMIPGNLMSNVTEINEAVTNGSMVTLPITLTNNGGLPVTFDIAANTGSRSGAVTDFGGPDEFGNFWIDSAEPNGPEFDWVDISLIGHRLNFRREGEFLGPYTIEFDFPFYGRHYSEFSVSPNGIISFTEQYPVFENESLPTFYAPRNMIAAFWTELSPSSGGDVYYYASPESLIISWIDLPHLYEEGTYSFEMILTPDGVIKFQYDEMTGPLNEATIGIQDSVMTTAMQIACNEEYISSNMATTIVPPWLTFNLYHGVLEPGADTVINAIMSGFMLENGLYTGDITINGNDMQNDPLSITIPVTIDVMTGIDDDKSVLPESFCLDQNFPNPFNAKTEINYALPVDSDVKLEIFDVLGRRVVTLLDQHQTAGYHSIIWDGTNESGSVVTSGMYFNKLSAGNDVFVKKMILLK